MRNRKALFSFIMLLILGQSILLQGCAADEGMTGSEAAGQETEAAAQTETGEELPAEDLAPVEAAEPLTVYFVNESGHYLEALQDYKAKYGLDIVNFKSYEELLKRYDEEKTAGSKTADVLILKPIDDIHKYFDNHNYSEAVREKADQLWEGSYLSYFHKSVRAGEFGDLTPFMEADAGFVRSDYIESVLDGGKVNGKQYVLPFEFTSNSCIVMDKLTDRTGELGFDKLDFAGMAKTLISLRETDEAAYPENVLLEVAGLGERVNFQISEMLRISGIDIVDYDNKSVCLDKDELSLLFELMYPVYAEGEAGKSKELAYKYYHDAATSIQIFLIHMSNNYAAETFRAWEINSALFDCGIKMYSIADFDGDYQAVIQKYGVMNADSNKKEEAYRLLKHLLDYSCVTSVNVLSSTNQRQHACVNKEHFNQTLFSLINQNKRIIQMEEYTVPLMSDEVRTIIQQHYDNLNEAVIPDSNVELIVHETMRPCLDDPALFDSAYEELVKRLEAYLAAE